MIEIGYLGTLGIKLQQNVQLSNALPGSTAVAGRRPYVGAIFAPGTVFSVLYQRAGNQRRGRNTGDAAQLRAVRTTIRVTYGASAGFRMASPYLKLIHILEGDHQRPAVPQRERSHGIREFAPQNSYDLSAEQGPGSV